MKTSDWVAGPPTEIRNRSFRNTKRVPHISASFVVTYSC